MSRGIGAEPGHHEHRMPLTRLQRVPIQGADIERATGLGAQRSRRGGAPAAMGLPNDWSYLPTPEPRQ